jgi:hypothetical protein
MGVQLSIKIRKNKTHEHMRAYGSTPTSNENSQPIQNNPNLTEGFKSQCEQPSKK